MQIRIQDTKIGKKAAKVTYFEENLQKDTSIYLCSKFDPLKEAEVWARHVYQPEIEVFMIYGMGMGYHISALEAMLSKGQQILVFETNLEVWKQLKEVSEYEKLQKRHVEFIITQEFKEISQGLNKYNDRRVSLNLYLPCVKIIPLHLRVLKEMFNSYSLSLMTKTDEEDIAENYKYNDQVVCSEVTELYGKLEGKPIIIVSGGPSLDKNIDLLKHINDKVIVFSSGRTLKLLLDKGIRVDYFCIIDAKEITYEQIRGVETADIPFVFLNTANHKVVSQYQGPKYRAYSQDSKQEKPGRIESGGSVATAMVDLAVRMGSSDIIFIGQDLAYTDEKSHCTNPISEDNMKKELHLKRVRGIDGSSLATSAALLKYKSWIERKILRHPEIRFMNATEGGAYIEGCQHLRLKEVLERFNAID